ncbi:uncharacterized protein CMU_027930 [Cryptosporidium muris RN66]|uniref:CTLH/CRA C-terminal to LisH motif domain-containing protein n=1 Tax=Cryptosporidium muris (strain RN66) TaxID=441375 RepID=B6ABN1_CRYMR|nr:uncharacterized protein CMU_027930 [Cryptosporidium muris RN66]EEA05783.1 hypothetical protein, conserved [Cryptosporidium muris RN66]|eukprot:XP_002140132.1 hypothetical protein [Cryptosporidium muris RN66]
MSKDLFKYIYINSIDESYIKCLHERNVAEIRVSYKLIESQIKHLYSYMKKGLKICDNEDRESQLDKLIEKINLLKNDVLIVKSNCEQLIEATIRILRSFKNKRYLDESWVNKNFNFKNMTQITNKILLDYFDRSRNYPNTRCKLFEIIKKSYEDNHSNLICNDKQINQSNIYNNNIESSNIDIQSEEIIDNYLLFEEYDKICNSLINLNETSHALQWISSHKSKINKSIKYKEPYTLLEVQLQIQNAAKKFIKSVQSETSNPFIVLNMIIQNMKDLIDLDLYSLHGNEIKEFIISCLFSIKKQKWNINTGIEYEDTDNINLISKYFKLSRWENILEQFKRTWFWVYGFPKKCTLLRLMDIGFSVLSTSICRHRITANCPSCSAYSEDYIGKLPLTHRLQSFIICPITGEFMDDNNPAFVLPNGYIISKNVLFQIFKNSNINKNFKRLYLV